MTTSLWIEEATEFGAEPAPLPDRCEVAILGGGVAGVCAALHLARLGVAVTLLEAGSIASRASGRNDGQVLLGLGEHYNRIVGQFGQQSARQLWQLIRENNEGLRREIHDQHIACDLREEGGYRLAESQHEWLELQEAAGLLATEGIPHRLHSATEVRQLLPADGFHGMLELPGEAVVQPAAMVRGLAHSAAVFGASICQQTPVVNIDGSAGKFDVHTKNGRTLRADMVVHCTSALASDLDDSGFLTAQVFPFRGQILATDPLPTEIAKRFGDQCMSSNFCYEYFRMHGGRFVIGGMRWSVKGEEQGTTDDSSHNEEVSANLISYVRRHFPIFAAHAFPHVWTGIMAGTKDGLPLCGELPGQPGRFAFCAFNGYGLSFAHIGAKILAEQIVEGQSEHPTAAMFAPRRFR